MTAGFWLIVGMAAIVLAAFLVWVGDRIADALDELEARYAEELEADAATYGEPTREEVEADYGPGCECTELCPMGPTCPGGILAQLPGAGCWRTHPTERPTQ